MNPTTVQGKKVLVGSTWLVIESNHGNHSGFNRTWRIWNVRYATKKEACADLAHFLNEANDVKPGQIGYTKKTDCGGEHDLKYFHVVRYNELSSFFDGCGSDIASQCLIKEVNEGQMELPFGKTCNDCGHVQRCTGLGCTKPENTVCDFSPSRFVQRLDGLPDPPDVLETTAAHTIAVWNKGADTADLVQVLKDWSEEVAGVVIGADEPRPSQIGEWPAVASVLRSGEAEMVAQMLVWYQVAECNDRFCKVEIPAFFKWLAGSASDSRQMEMAVTLSVTTGRLRNVLNTWLPVVIPCLVTAKSASAFSKAWAHLLASKEPVSTTHQGSTP